MKRFGSVALAVTLVVAFGVSGMPLAQANEPESAIEALPPLAQPASPPITQLIVKYKPGVPVAEAPGVATGDRAVDGVELEPGRAMSLGMRTVELSEPLTQTEAQMVSAELEEDPRVLSASPDDWAFPSTTNPNDPFYQIADPSSGGQWGLKTGYGINGPAAWGTTTGSNDIVVAILDTGIVAHPDHDATSARQVAGYDFVTDVLQANDGNGRDPDPTDPGDWISTTDRQSGGGPFSDECDVSDSSWHGTHVNGIVNASTNNSTGVAAVAPQVKTQPLRVLGKCGGSMSDVVDAIVWASGGVVAGLDNNPTPADVINLSLGSNSTCSGAMQAGINTAVANGATVVVAAGNSNSPAGLSSPAGCGNVVTVGATSSAGERAGFSNYGDAVDVAAPGVAITGLFNAGKEGATNPNYAMASGTSQASPHVAGLAALILSRSPEFTPAQVEARLKANVTPFPGAGGACDPAESFKTCGTGIANAASVTAGFAPATPAAPNVAAVAGAVNVSWNAPEDFGETITGYTVKTYRAGVGVTGVGCATLSTSCSVSGLVKGTAYTFTVTAANVNGSSVESGQSSAVTPSTVPATPAAPTAIPGPGSMTLLWLAPSNNGSAITGYAVTTLQAGNLQGGKTCATTTALRCVVTGLTPGLPYTFRVTATNANGGTTSAQSSSATPQVVPLAPAKPTAPSVVAGNAQVKVSWNAPNNNGATITGYVVRTFRGSVVQAGMTCSATSARTCTVMGLTNGIAYRFTVAATNSKGTSVSNQSAAVVPATKPAAVRSLRATYTATVAKVSWLPPAGNGGAPVTGYRVRLSNNAGRSWTGWKTVLPRALNVARVRGASQRVQVAAVNRVGSGPASTLPLTPRRR